MTTSGEARSGADAVDSLGAEHEVSKRGLFWILAGIVLVGFAAGCKWLRDLPR